MNLNNLPPLELTPFERYLLAGLLNSKDWQDTLVAIETAGLEAEQPEHQDGEYHYQFGVMYDLHYKLVDDEAGATQTLADAWNQVSNTLDADSHAIRLQALAKLVEDVRAESYSQGYENGYEDGVDDK